MSKYVSDKPVLETDDFIIYTDEDMIDYTKMVILFSFQIKFIVLTF